MLRSDILSNFIIRDPTVEEIKIAIDKEKKMIRFKSKYMFLWLGFAILSVTMAKSFAYFYYILAIFQIFMAFRVKKEVSRHEDIIRMLCIHLKLREFRAKLMKLKSQQSNSQNCS
jgi:hypothetical protein